MSLQAVAVSTKGLQVTRVIVPTITVYMVNVELTRVLWYKATFLTEILLMFAVRREAIRYIKGR